MAKEIIIARHAQTDVNVGGDILGKLDVPLNETGREQVQQLAEVLLQKNIHPQVIIFSPLERARATANGIADVVGGNIETSEALQEVDYGDYEGASKDIYQEIEYGYNTEAMGRGHAETAEDIEGKAQQLLDEIFQRPEQTFVLVTHALVASILTQLLLDEPRDFAHIQPLKNADFNYFVVEKTGNRYLRRDVKKNVIKGRLQI